MKTPRRFDSRLVVLLCIGVAVAVAGTIPVRWLPGVRRLELLAYDWHMKTLPTLPPDSRIIIIGLDDESPSHLPLDRPSYPLPRNLHAHLLQELQQAGAKVVGFDMFFSRY